MSGLACARRLAQHGYRPTVFEKSRGLGGRLATRRTAGGLAFDHGAQYLTARSAPFRRTVAALTEAGAAAPWRPLVNDRPAAATDGWLVGTPAMNALVKPLADGIDIHLTSEVTPLKRDGNSWRVGTSEEEDGDPFDIVVSTVPAPQARVLLAAEPRIVESLSAVSIAPCWALMVGFASRADPGFDVRRSTADDFAWICRNASKPGRSAEADTWVIHAGPAWSERHLELDRERIAAKMIEKFLPAFGDRPPKIFYASAHRWRFALTTAPLGQPFICSDDRTLFAGGDWCLGARVEFAFESGEAIANALMGGLTDE